MLSHVSVEQQENPGEMQPQTEPPGPVSPEPSRAEIYWERMSGRVFLHSVLPLVRTLMVLQQWETPTTGRRTCSNPKGSEYFTGSEPSSYSQLNILWEILEISSNLN
ncbi:hypothetical protein CHARACLAT_029299 [Characodon lateralis]|uniref:Uncharacterized protein n=1 Tax=Characodon lateralis TaxID=208331 RepID=A0ABU7CSZ5_9TELE|nr:hypothetical protein [Characodon lateralis]